MSIVDEVKNLKAPQGQPLGQIDLMRETDREYKELADRGLMRGPERQVASSMERSATCLYNNCGRLE